MMVKQLIGHLIEGGRSGFAAQLGGWRSSNGGFDDAGAGGTTGLARPVGVPTRGVYSFHRYNRPVVPLLLQPRLRSLGSLSTGLIGLFDRR